MRKKERQRVGKNEEGKIREFDGSKRVGNNFFRYWRTRIPLSGDDWSPATYKTLRQQPKALSSSCKTENPSPRPLCDSYSSSIGRPKLAETFSEMENLEGKILSR
ncbi:hypothetical protein MRB53_011809 [Persea americana]|uniref:Uncharacterized protein n=1 Tax=Persea americana TaxID=3435 RepID=A0ACC2LVL7_PERAE|nr:hypothetical protein MRB53_011809 [Persea americana]